MIRTIFSALLFSIMLMVAAEAESPTAEMTPPQQRKPARDQEPAARNEKVTTPLPIVVNVLPTPKTEEEAAEERREREANTVLERKLVDLTADLAFYTAGLFAATIALAIATAALVIFSRRQASDMRSSLAITKAAADAAAKSADVAEKTLVATNRPWISVSAGIASPLSHTSDGWYVVIQYVLKNVGNGPAAGADVHATMMPYVVNSWPSVDSLKGRSVFEMPTLETDTVTELKKLCDGAIGMQRARGGFGKTLFPGEEIRGEFGIYGNSPLFEKAKALESYTGHFHLLVCASYGFTIDDTQHVTAKAFTLYKRKDADGKFGKIDLSGDHVRHDGLCFESVPDSKTDYAT